MPARHRLMAARNIERIKIDLEGQEFETAVKIARDSEGVLLNISAEFEDCKKNRKSQRDSCKRSYAQGRRGCKKAFLLRIPEMECLKNQFQS